MSPRVRAATSCGSRPVPVLLWTRCTEPTLKTDVIPVDRYRDPDIFLGGHDPRNAAAIAPSKKDRSIRSAWARGGGFRCLPRRAAQIADLIHGSPWSGGLDPRDFFILHIPFGGSLLHACPACSEPLIERPTMSSFLYLHRQLCFGLVSPIVHE